MLILVVTASALVASADAALPPWTSGTHPADQAKSHVEEIATDLHRYQVLQGGAGSGAGALHFSGLSALHQHGTSRRCHPEIRHRGPVAGLRNP